MKQMIQKMLCGISMRRNMQPKTEFNIFISRNLVYILIGLLCFLLCIKQSEVPFLWKYNSFTKFLFQHTLSNSLAGAIVCFFYELSFAFFTSFLFYLLVNYFPKRRLERSAYILVANRLTEIDSLIGKLFAFLMFITHTGSNLEQLTPDKAADLCGISFKNEDIYCHTKIIQLSTGNIVEESNPGYINQFFGLMELSKAVIKQIDDINELTCASKLDDMLIYLLTEIKQNRMLSLLANMPKSFIEMLGSGSYGCNYSPTDVVALYILLLQLRSYPYPKNIVIIEEASQDSIQEAKATFERMKRDYPASFKLMERYNRAQNLQRN